MPSSPRPLPPELHSEAFALARLPELGISVERARRSDLDRPFHGVVSQGIDLDDLAMRALALQSRRGMPPFAVSHITAARLVGLPLPRSLRDDRIHVTVAHPARAPRLVGVAGHAFRLDSGAFEHHAVVNVDTGERRYVRVVSAPWLFVGLASQLDVDDLTAIADALGTRAMRENLDVDLSAALAEGRRGSSRARRALALSVVGARSRPETLLRLQLRRSGLPRPLVGFEINGEGWRATPDLAWPQFRVLVEYEGDHHRTDARQFRHDLRRFDRFDDAGWSTLRATRSDVFGDTTEFIERLARRLVRGGWRPASRWRPRPVSPARW